MYKNVFESQIIKIYIVYKNKGVSSVLKDEGI